MNYEAISNLISNKIDNSGKDYFAAIIGVSPSKGARSPSLWNYVFEHFKNSIKMIPFDVSAESITILMDVLYKDPKFIGGAIAVPYKEVVAMSPVIKLSDEAKLIGAVNALYRNGGDLIATNTDGEAAIRALEKEVGFLNGKKALVIGLGGVGKAVAVYMKSAVGSSGVVYVTNRSINSKGYARASSLEWVSYDDFDGLLPNIDILVNCTTLGSVEMFGFSPVSIEQLKLLSNTSVVYDVIYNPVKTKLIILAESLGLKTLNGSEMNIEQAALALHKTCAADISLSEIKNLMNKKVMEMTIEKNA
jgi:shikimate dehydrogenase